jgi:hypothetical protein
MLAAERLFRRSDSTPTESLEWTIALGRGVIGAESHTLAVVGPNELSASFDTDHVFTQPSSREVATKLFTALAMLRQWSPYATVTVVFGDHAPALEIRRARELAREHHDRVVVIEGESPDDDRRNDLVCVGTVRALWDLGRAGAPALVELMDTLVPMIDTDDEDAAIAAIYSLAPFADFNDILERSPERLLTLGNTTQQRRRATTVREVSQVSAA